MIYRFVKAAYSLNYYIWNNFNEKDIQPFIKSSIYKLISPILVFLTIRFESSVKFTELKQEQNENLTYNQVKLLNRGTLLIRQQHKNKMKLQCNFLPFY